MPDPTVLLPGSKIQLAVRVGGRQGCDVPTGAVGGDLSGSLPNPNVFVGELDFSPGAVQTTLDSLAIATYKAVDWAFEAIKGTNTYKCIISACHDGTTPVWVEFGTIVAPGTGTFDFTYLVDIAAANMNLKVTPATAGWSFRVRRIEHLTA